MSDDTTKELIYSDNCYSFIWEIYRCMPREDGKEYVVIDDEDGFGLWERWFETEELARQYVVEICLDLGGNFN